MTLFELFDDEIKANSITHNMTKQKILQEKINNRDTELQRIYDLHTEKVEDELKIIADAQARLKISQDMVDLCIKRAKEQNCLHVL